MSVYRNVIALAEILKQRHLIAQISQDCFSIYALALLEPQVYPSPVMVALADAPGL
jgi:hypothetical protein